VSPNRCGDVGAAGECRRSRQEPALRERMLATADTFVDVELGNFEDYLPGDAEFGQITAPVQLIVSEDGRPNQHQAVARLAERFGVPVHRVPGTHVSYWDHPEEMTAAIRPFLRRLPA
jgi:pimeloyl-ACP methyl ester carboxylesterase